MGSSYRVVTIYVTIQAQGDFVRSNRSFSWKIRKQPRRTCMMKSIRISLEIREYSCSCGLLFRINMFFSFSEK